MDMSKYRAMFLSESAEHLKSMARLVITLEENPSNREVIDALFREAHSIKGMAASMGYEHTTELAHHLEDLMDGFRQGGEVPSAAIDHLLAGIDLLEGLVEDIAGERSERAIDAFLSATTPVAAAAEPEALPAPPLAAIPTAAAPASVAPLSAPAQENEAAPARTLQVVLELAADAAAPAARALLALRELATLGRLESSAPTETQLRQGMPVRRIEARLETAATAATLQQRLARQTDITLVTVLEPSTRESGGVRREDTRTVRVRTELLDRFINLTGELITTRYMLQAAAHEERWRDTREGLDLLARLITDLHQHVLQVRMMPLESITGRLPRLVRELARKSGKELRLRVEGADLELDRAILEELVDPLVHMVRNAADHGIERVGEITVRAWREKDLALLEVADNGRGMDPELIRQKALDKGLVSPQQARLLRERDVLQLVCLPGFSTAPTVTETSGRGVGMDVVKAAVESLGGTIEIDSAPGQGTRILLKLPLSVAIIQILLVACAGRTVGIPISRVHRVLELDASEIQSSGRQRVLALDEEMVPVTHFNRLLNLDEPAATASSPAIITELRGRKTVLLVERLLGQREAFVKSVAFPLDRLTGLSGATITADGNIVFIVDPLSLLDTTGALPCQRPPEDRQCLSPN